MWGEFEESDKKKNDFSKNDHIEPQQSTPACLSQDSVDDEAPVRPLKDRIIHHIASSSVVLKSQQRYEPDLTFRERERVVEELLEKPGNFLYRFGKHLEREHFQYFLKFEGDPEVDHYVAESLKHLNKHTAKVTIKNRRYAAMQEMRRSGTYFSEKEMERRDPLLYDQLIARHQTEEEKRKYEEAGRNEASETRFSSLLLEHIDNCSERNLKKQQEEEEDDMLEEEDTDEEVEEEDDERMEEAIESGEKQLFREEFYSSLYHRFLRGNDTEFDYGKVDASDDYDLLDIRARDEEERYFDEDDDFDEEQSSSTKSEIEVDSAMCCG
ncbi:coiled-coil domain-containing protein 97-like [Macrobrachium rosenbergii]|uniref:coiled-coil domain-containing protein 97-like n=1 Tax=Macrobrachium rosenbergii TaxID=79674 RepID=UPI0034D54429